MRNRGRALYSDDEVADLAGAFERTRLGERFLLAKTELG